MKLSGKFLINQRRWRPTSSAYFQVVYGKKVVLFEALKTRFILNSLVSYTKHIGTLHLPLLFLDPTLKKYARFGKRLSLILGGKLTIMFRWPSGFLTNYFIIMPAILKMLRRLGPSRLVKRRYSPTIPIEVPSLFVIGSYRANAALQEANIMDIPVSMFLGSAVNFYNKFITFPLFFNSDSKLNRWSIHSLLLINYYKSFLASKFDDSKGKIEDAVSQQIVGKGGVATKSLLAKVRARIADLKKQRLLVRKAREGKKEKVEILRQLFVLKKKLIRVRRRMLLLKTFLQEPKNLSIRSSLQERFKNISMRFRNLYFEFRKAALQARKFKINVKVFLKKVHNKKYLKKLFFAVKPQKNRKVKLTNRKKLRKNKRLIKENTFGKKKA